MDKNSKTGGMLPSAIALNAALKARLGDSQEPTMLTPYELELLRQVGKEVDEYLDGSERLKAFLERMRLPHATSE
jgi:hypothetical protein